MRVLSTGYSVLGTVGFDEQIFVRATNSASVAQPKGSGVFGGMVRSNDGTIPTAKDARPQLLWDSLHRLLRQLLSIAGHIFVAALGEEIAELGKLRLAVVAAF
jgi:hypothetical protein